MQLIFTLLQAGANYKNITVMQVLITEAQKKWECEYKYGDNRRKQCKHVVV